MRLALQWLTRRPLVRLFCCCLTKQFFDSFFDRAVSISEDSETFQSLLSFIYPDKISTVFTSLDVLLPVLNAASKYQMRVVVDALKVQVMSRTVSGNTYREALLYDDPLRVYAKAKELKLDDLANAAANATLNIDITRTPDTHSDLASMPALWLWQLMDIRKERTTWLLTNCRYQFYVGSMDLAYKFAATQPNQPDYSYFRAFACGCGVGNGVASKAIPASLLDKIKANPCPRAIRKIDFNVELRCLRCGAAAAAHFNRVCKEYEEAFGMF